MLRAPRKRVLQPRQNHRLLLQTVASTKLEGAARPAAASTYATISAHITRLGGMDTHLDSHTEGRASHKAVIFSRDDVREGHQVQGDGASTDPLRGGAAEIIEIVGTTLDRKMTLFINQIR